MKYSLYGKFGPKMDYPIFEKEIHDDFDNINDVDIEIEENQIEIPELYDSPYSDSPTPPPSEYFHKPRPKESVIQPPTITFYDDSSCDFDDYFPEVMSPPPSLFY